MCAMKVCVLGAGVIGMSTGVCLVEQVRGVEVTVLAEHFSPYTTGDCAAGIVTPFSLGSTPLGLIR